LDNCRSCKNGKPNNLPQIGADIRLMLAVARIRLFADSGTSSKCIQLSEWHVSLNSSRVRRTALAFIPNHIFLVNEHRSSEKLNLDRVMFALGHLRLPRSVEHHQIVPRGSENNVNSLRFRNPKASRQRFVSLV
jgi:hypothetical protein